MQVIASSLQDGCKLCDKKALGNAKSVRKALGKIMTLIEAVTRNPYDPKKGNESAYCRYLRYNVDGYYTKPIEEVKALWKSVCTDYLCPTDRQ